jgi:hypothetical protein
MSVHKETVLMRKPHKSIARLVQPSTKSNHDYVQYLNRLDFLARLLESNNGGFEAYVRKMAKLPNRTFA